MIASGVFDVLNDLTEWLGDMSTRWWLATMWAGYAAIIGFAFGDLFEDDHTKSFWLAFGTALGITGLIEIVRWCRHRNDSEAHVELIEA